MPRNGSGTYTLPAGNPVLSGTTITSTWGNTTLGDIATALTNSLTKNGETMPTANLPMGTYRFTGLGSGVNGTDSVTLGQVGAGLNGSGSVTLDFTQTGTGATARDFADKCRDIVSVYDFGAVGDGTTSDTAAIQAAIDSLGAKGGTVILPSTGKYKVGNLTINANVRLLGEIAGLDTTSDNINFYFENLGSALITTAGTTITMQKGSSMERCILYPAALGATVEQSTTANFAGICLTVAGYGIVIKNNIILGYSTGIASSGYSRIYIEQNAIDCLSAMDIASTYDTTRIINNHCWPYLTQGAFWNSGGDYASRDKTKLYRSGYGLKLSTASDGTQVDGNLFYGFLVGIHLTAVTAVNFGNNWIDHPPGVNRANNYGIYFGANVTSVAMQTAYVWGSKYGIVCEMNASEYVCIDTAHIAYIDDVAAAVTSGDVSINTIVANNTGSFALSIGSSSSNINIQNYRFTSVGASQPISIPASATMEKLEFGTGYWDGAAGGNLLGTNALTPPIVASADPLPLPVNGDVFLVSGTTGFGNITGGWGGRRVTLIFQNALTVFDGAVINISGNFTTTANDVLNIFYDGTQWLELSRSVN